MYTGKGGHWSRVRKAQRAEQETPEPESGQLFRLFETLSAPASCILRVRARLQNDENTKHGLSVVSPTGRCQLHYESVSCYRIYLVHKVCLEECHPTISQRGSLNEVAKGSPRQTFGAEVSCCKHVRPRVRPQTSDLVVVSLEVAARTEDTTRFIPTAFTDF